MSAGHCQIPRTVPWSTWACVGPRPRRITAKVSCSLMVMSPSLRQALPGLGSPVHGTTLSVASASRWSCRPDPAKPGGQPRARRQVGDVVRALSQDQVGQSGASSCAQPAGREIPIPRMVFGSSICQGPAYRRRCSIAPQDAPPRGGGNGGSVPRSKASGGVLPGRFASAYRKLRAAFRIRRATYCKQRL